MCMPVPSAIVFKANTETLSLRDDSNMLLKFRPSRINVPIAMTENGFPRDVEMCMLQLGDVDIEYKPTMRVATMPTRAHMALSVRVMKSQVGANTFDGISNKANKKAFPALMKEIIGD